MVLEPEQVDPRDEEIFRLQQLLFAAEAEIEKLEGKISRPKKPAKYKMTKSELKEWRELARLGDLVDARRQDFFYACCVSQDQARAIADAHYKAFILANDLYDIAIYGDDPRNPVTDHRYATCFYDLKAIIDSLKIAYAMPMNYTSQRRTDWGRKSMSDFAAQYDKLKNGCGHKSR